MPGVLSPVLEPAWDTQGLDSGARTPYRVDRYFPMLSWHRPSPFGLSRWDGSFEGTPSGNCLLTLPAARCISGQAGERADFRAACVECDYRRLTWSIASSSALSPEPRRRGPGGSRWRPSLAHRASSRAALSASHVSHLPVRLPPKTHKRDSA